MRFSFSSRCFTVTVAALLLILTTFTTNAATLNSQVDRLDVGLNETFTLNVTYSEQIMSGAPDFAALDKDFEIITTSQNSQFRSINGSVESFTRWQLVLMPRRAGKLKIPALTFRGVSSQEVTINASNAPAQQGQFKGTQDIYLETDVDKQSVFVQEQLLLTLRLYTNTSLSNIEPEELKLDYASAELVNDNQFQRVINGRPYIVVERTYAIFPQKSGELTIPSMRWDLQLGSRASSLFDRLDNRQLRRLRTEAKTIKVEATPASYPANQDWLPAKSLTLSEDWATNPKEFKVGEPITRTVIIQTDGISAAQLPQLSTELPPSLNSYAEPATTEEEKSATGIRTIQRQTQALVPTQAGEFELPPVELTWWNTTEKRLEKAVLPAQKIFVYSNGIDLTAQPTLAQPITADATGLPPASNEMTSNSGNLRLWQILTVTFGCLWLVFTGLFLRVWLKLKAPAYGRTEIPAASANNTNTEKQNLHRLKQLAKQQSKQQFIEPAAARAAILEWARAYWPIHPPAGLQQLSTRVGDNPLLKEQLNALNEALYSESENASQAGQKWDLQVIAAELKKLKAEIKTNRSETAIHLKPLYKQG